MDGLRTALDPLPLPTYQKVRGSNPFGRAGQTLPLIRADSRKRCGRPVGVQDPNRRCTLSAMGSHPDSDSAIAGIRSRLDTLRLQESSLEGQDLSDNRASQAEIND